LAAAIGGLLDDSKRAATVGAAARQRIEAYSPKAVGAALATALRLRDEPPSGENALQRSYRHRVDAWRSYTTARRSRKTASVRREALAKVALRAGRFLGISDLARSIAEAHTRLDAQQEQLDALRGERGREAGRR
jgi:hypothetical protein